MIAGAVTLGVGYLLSSVVSGVLLGVGAAQKASDGTSCMDGVGWGFVPLVGPAIAASGYSNEVRVLGEADGTRGAGYHVDCTGGATPMAVFGTVTTLTQTGGAAMLVLGLAVREPVNAAQSPPRRGLRFAGIGPGAPGAPVGVHLSFTGL